MSAQKRPIGCSVRGLKFGIPSPELRGGGVR